MVAPPHLLHMAGVSKPPSRLARSVLIVIDAQAEYLTGRLPLDGIDAALRRLAVLIARARLAGAAVIHVRQLGNDSGLFDPDGPGGAFVPQAMPIPGDIVIGKALPNAFSGTDLGAQLALVDRPPLILAGFMTHVCVDATARSGLDQGYAVTVVADATATRALPDALGGPFIPAATIQSVALAALAGPFASVVLADAIPD